MNEHPMMSREEYARRFPDDESKGHLPPELAAIRDKFYTPVSGDGTPPPDPECCVHCGENEYGKADDACWWCYMIAKQTAETAIEELNAMRGRAKPSEYEVERVAKAIWNAQYTHLDAETLFGDPWNPYWVEAANEARAQARAAIEALRGRAEPAEGERRTEALLDRIETLLTDAENEAMRWPTSMAEYRHFALPKIVEARKVAARLGAALRVPGVEDQR